MSTDIDPRFAAALPEQVDSGEPFRTAKAFRRAWFGQEHGGQALFFLFSKNLSVTNVQFAELLSLLRLHTYERRTQERAKALHFVTSSEFDRLFVEMIEPFEKHGDELRQIVGPLYSDIFSRTVVVDPRYGSCNVFLPPSLIANMAAMAGQAGYIHSCGYLVFIRNVVKADPGLLFTNLHKHLLRYPPSTDKKLRFFVYADEDFTKEDRSEASRLRAGLDDVKIHVEKAWFRTQRLVDVIGTLKEQMPDLVFGAGRGFRADHDTQIGQDDIDRARTLWLIQDHGIGNPPEQRGVDRYYVCYDQLFYAQNAVHLFDENKPAWHDHTTLPPSLAGSLVNIIRTPERHEASLSIVDPFAGTGTSLLEVIRLPKAKFTGFDNDPGTERLIYDNLQFFDQPREGLINIHRQLLDAKQELLFALDENPAAIGGTRALSLARQVFRTEDVVGQASVLDGLPSPRDEDLPNDLAERILVYVAMRTSKRHSARFSRAAETSDIDWCDAYLAELETLNAQIARLIELRDRQELDAAATESYLRGLGYFDDSSKQLAMFFDDYSMGVMPRAQAVQVDRMLQESDPKREFELYVGSERGDARGLPAATYDVVIGDPPYGFNTVAEASDLAKLYSEFARAALLSLRDGGDLVLCLPERSHSGRYSPAFTHRALVLQQLFLVAGEEELQLVFPRNSVRGAEHLFDADYYWESQRALRRSVLHVQVRFKAPRSDNGDGSMPQLASTSLTH